MFIFIDIFTVFFINMMLLAESRGEASKKDTYHPENMHESKDI